jgi:hypothetical protein
VDSNRQDGPDPGGGPGPSQSLLHRLKGGELFMVTFIADYVELSFQRFGDDGKVFDSARLDCFVWPRIVMAADVLTFGDPGYPMRSVSASARR